MSQETRLIAESSGRLDVVLSRMLATCSRTQIAKLIEDSLVSVNGITQTKAGLKIVAGCEIVIGPQHPEQPTYLDAIPIPLDIRFEDEHLIIINKPRGLVTHPAPSYSGPTLVHALLSHSKQLSTMGGDFRPGIVHRLDKDTTGLIVVAKSDRVHAHLASQFERKTAERRYFAVCYGELPHAAFNIDAPIARDTSNRQRMAISPGGKPAFTSCRVLARYGEDSVVAIKLGSGRTHQIRVHLRSIGHPVLGDLIYAPKSLHLWPLQLHAAWLSLEHPIDNIRLAIYASPPEDFLARDLVSEADIALNFSS